MKLLGAVLAGGESRRFGSDKALALLEGKPLIQHAIEALSAQTDAVIVCGREWSDWVPDRPVPGLGPLGGINAALHCARDRGFEWVLSVPCDVPMLPVDLAFRFAETAYLADIPVIGLWSVALAPLLDAHLASGGDRSMKGWARTAGAVPVALATDLANVNTPADLAALVRAGLPATPRSTARPRRPKAHASRRGD